MLVTAALLLAATPSPQPTCPGVLSTDGQACCSASCGVCGGRKCQQRAGGERACCASFIRKQGACCEGADAVPPCRMPSNASKLHGSRAITPPAPSYRPLLERKAGDGPARDFLEQLTSAVTAGRVWSFLVHDRDTGRGELPSTRHINSTCPHDGFPQMRHPRVWSCQLAHNARIEPPSDLPLVSARAIWLHAGDVGAVAFRHQRVRSRAELRQWPAFKPACGRHGCAQRTCVPKPAECDLDVAIGSLERASSCRKPRLRTLVLSGEDWIGNHVQRAWLGAAAPRAQAWWDTGLFDRIFVEQKDVQLPGFETYPLGLSRHYTIGREQRLLDAVRLAADLHERGETRGVLAAWGRRAQGGKGGDGRTNYTADAAALDSYVRSVPFLRRTDTDAGNYFSELARHRFLLAPRGGGLQSPKFLEALLMMVVPITKRYAAFEDLQRYGWPIVLVDSWEEVTPTALEHWWASLSPQLLAGRWIATVEGQRSLLFGDAEAATAIHTLPAAPQTTPTSAVSTTSPGKNHAAGARRTSKHAKKDKTKRRKRTGSSSDAAQLLPVRLPRGGKLRCPAAVILAGMPRTGSTLMLRFAHAALAALQTSHAFAGYWRLPAHLNHSFPRWGAAPMNATERHTWISGKKRILQKSLSSPAGTPIIMFKSHEFAPRLLTACRRRAVLLTHRCVKDELMSATKLGWLSANADNQTAAIRDWVEDYSLWRSSGALDVPYELMQYAPREAFHAIVDYLAESFGLQDRAQRTAELSSQQLAELGGEGNPGIPSTRAMEPPANTHAALRSTYGRFAHVVEHMKLRWACNESDTITDHPAGATVYPPAKVLALQRPTADVVGAAAQGWPATLTALRRSFSRYVVIDVRYGLSNRLRALGSALALAAALGRPLVLVWRPEGHCNCSFGGIFPSVDVPGLPFAVVDLVNHVVLSTLPADSFTAVDLVAERWHREAPLPVDAQRHLFIRSHVLLPHAASQKQAQVQQQLQLLASAMLPKEAQVADSQAIGVHVRHAFPDLAIAAELAAQPELARTKYYRVATMRRASSWANFVPLMEELARAHAASVPLSSPPLRFFVAADTEQAYAGLAARFGEQRILRNLRSCPTDGSSCDARTCAEQHGALTDMASLGRTALILGSGFSSFSTLASQLGGGIRRTPVPLLLAGQHFGPSGADGTEAWANSTIGTKPPAKLSPEELATLPAWLSSWWAARQPQLVSSWREAKSLS